MKPSGLGNNEPVRFVFPDKMHNKRAGAAVIPRLSRASAAPMAATVSGASTRPLR
jgi:hypothetical protein